MRLLDLLNDQVRTLATRLPFGLGPWFKDARDASTADDRRRQQAYERILASDSAKERFSQIYARNIWGSPESGSGPGSEAAYTQRLRDWLVETLPALKVHRFVDAPCGDFNWMRLVLPHVNVDYHGFDIVESVIDRNRRKYGGDRVRFDVADLCSDPLPSCDLLMVRDCLVHLAFADVNKVLANLARTDYRYLLTTTHTVESALTNTDIVTGSFRFIDLFRAPFHFDPDSVKARVADFPEGFAAPREMVLIAKADVPTRLVHEVMEQAV